MITPFKLLVMPRRALLLHGRVRRGDAQRRGP